MNHRNKFSEIFKRRIRRQSLEEISIGILASRIVERFDRLWTFRKLSEKFSHSYLQCTRESVVRVVTYHLPKEEFDSFGLWAFGDTYKTMYGTKNFTEAWNERHADMLLLEDDNAIVTSVKTLIDLYTQHVILNRSN